MWRFIHGNLRATTAVRAENSFKSSICVLDFTILDISTCLWHLFLTNLYFDKFILTLFSRLLKLLYFYIKVFIFLLSRVEYFWILRFLREGSLEQNSSRNAEKLLQTRRLRLAATLDFLRFSSSLNTGRRRKGARGCELCFRDKSERKTSKQRAKRVYERPFGIVHCSSLSHEA